MSLGTPELERGALSFQGWGAGKEMKAPLELSPGGPLSGGNTYLPKPEPADGALSAPPPHTRDPGAWEQVTLVLTVPALAESVGEPRGPLVMQWPQEEPGKAGGWQQCKHSRKLGAEAPRPPAGAPACRGRLRKGAGCSPAPPAAKQAPECQETAL